MVENYRGQLVNYFMKNLGKGYTAESLKFALIGQGYSRSVIDVALEQAHKELAEKAPVLKERPVIRHEVFDENDEPVSLKKPWWKFW